MRAQGRRDFAVTLRRYSQKVLREDDFLQELKREEMRGRRAGRPISLILIMSRAGAKEFKEVATPLCAAIRRSIRISDICGFMKNHTMIAVVLVTQDDVEKADAAHRIVKNKIAEELEKSAGKEIAGSLNVISCLIPPNKMQLFLKKCTSGTTEEKGVPTGSTAAGPCVDVTVALHIDRQLKE